MAVREANDLRWCREATSAEHRLVLDNSALHPFHISVGAVLHRPEVEPAILHAGEPQRAILRENPAPFPGIMVPDDGDTGEGIAVAATTLP